MKAYLVVQLIGGALSSVRTFPFNPVGKTLAQQYFLQIISEVILTAGVDPSELDELLDPIRNQNSPSEFIDGDHSISFTVSADSVTGDVNLPLSESLDTVWAGLNAYREDLIPEGDESYDEQWDEICGAMALLREAAAENLVLMCKLIDAARLTQHTQEALLNVPVVGDVYDQQHSDTHMRAMLLTKDFLIKNPPMSF